MGERNTRPTFPTPGKGIYLLDDHALIRRGFRNLLEHNDLIVSGESASAREAVRRIPACNRSWPSSTRTFPTVRASRYARPSTPPIPPSGALSSMTHLTRPP